MPSVLYGNLSDRPQKANVKLSNNMLLGGEKKLQSSKRMILVPTLFHVLN